MKKQTIYVCTEGCYSDYSIRAVFSTRKLADEACAACGWDSIAEWKLDEMAGAHKGRAYRCGIILASGEIYQEWNYDEVVSANQRSEKRTLNENHPRGRVLISTSFVSAAHARKLAIEARQEILRKEQP